MAIPNQMGDNDSRKPEEADSENTRAPSGSHEHLLAWIVPKLEHARNDRDNKYGKRWKEYTRLWRGFWVEADKNTDSERSRLISPALQQAVEMTVAEIEDAVFNREAWFDVTDDIAEQNKNAAVEYRDKLLEDFNLDAVPDALSKAFLLGAVYGTGIAKINVVRKEEKTFVEGEAVSRDRVAVTAEALRPDEFIIDPTATAVDEALFVAHDMVRPKHRIKERMSKGVYRKVRLDEYTGAAADPSGKGDKNVQPADNAVKITEYFGKVPGWMLSEKEASKGMVEAIVTIANDGLVLRAVASPYTMKDRPVVAYQHDSAPGEFWGRGVCEKGYNPQRALDAEMRARIDALALLSAPMMGVDVTRMPRHPDTRVRPGKTLFTRGRPSEILEPVAIGNPSQLGATFQHTSDLERMVQMGTGAMDSATPVGVNSRNETASGMSMLQTGFIKRSRRTMQNIERQFLNPFIRKALWRYMQFDPDRYPVDFQFQVAATMGIMAKEVENAQLINMLGFVPPESPAHAIILSAIFENTASANKKELKQAMEEMTKPPSEEQQQLQQRMQELEMESAEAESDKKKAEAREALAQAQLAEAKAERERALADLEDDKVDISAANAASTAENVRIRRLQAEIQQERNEIDRAELRQSRQNSE